MTFPIQQRSFPAGASSTDPDRSRLVEVGQSKRLLQLTDAFPNLRKDITSSTLIISAYPASLGLTGVAPLADTYLHAPTSISAFRWAEQESRPVLFAAQPLAGADILLEFCRSDFNIPSRILWAVGGYPMPLSLEVFIREMLKSRGCELVFLYSYGVAEIGHTCFAATDRSESGQPCYKKVASTVSAETVGDDCLLRLTSATGVQVLTGDHALVSGDVWTLTSGVDRLHPNVLAELESWSHSDWSRRTGYLHATATETSIQVRRNVELDGEPSEVEFHNFWRRYGGSFTTKPVWKLHCRD
ncbi:MAG: hypothetical protein H6822_20300 [Planctomycetaceae bacterium]|nr:hypothetical protein [Planctomycetaceae bacterium]